MLAISVPATSAIAVKIILNVVSTPETIFSSINAARPRNPTLPGTSSIMPGTCVMVAGRSSNRAYQLLATPTVNAPRNTPISGPKNLTPRRLPPTANAPAITIHTASLKWARSKMVNAIGIVTTAIASVHAGKGAARAMTGSPSSRLATAPPTATPKPMLKKMTNAPLNRDVPADRFRVESSISAMVNVNPGISTISPASVAFETAYGPMTKVSDPANADAAPAATNSKTLPNDWYLSASSDRRPMIKPIKAEA